MVLYNECKWLKSRDMKMLLTCFLQKVFTFFSVETKKKNMSEVTWVAQLKYGEISSGNILNFLFIIYFKECSYLISIIFDYEPLRDV